MKEITSNHIWTKAQTFIFDKYGKNISFKSLNLSLKNDLFFIEGDDLIIPLNRQSSFIGEVIVKHGSVLSQSEKLEVTDFIKFLIEPHAYNQHLQRQEEQKNLQLVKVSSTYNSNIYSLYDNVESKSLTQVISNIIHLKSCHAMISKKTALKIHEMTENQIFISFDDIQKSLSSKDDFSQLGRSTIYIEHIEKIPENQILMISHYLDSNTCEALFILGSNKTESEIDSLNLPFSMSNSLKAFTFDIDKVPVSQQTSTEILELLFFNLDQTIGS